MIQVINSNLEKLELLNAKPFFVFGGAVTFSIYSGTQGAEIFTDGVAAQEG